jgi:hypothetical protein
MTEAAVAVRQCSKCSRTEAEVEFYDGKNNWCRPCMRSYQHDRYIAQKRGAWEPKRGPNVNKPKPEVAITSRDEAFLAYGEEVVRQCGRNAANAVDIITSGWARLP